MTGSLVEYDGFLASGAAALNPAILFVSRDFSVGAQGSWTVFESGSQILQATGAAAWLVPSAREHTRMEWSAAAGLSRYATQPASGHLLARGRFHFFGTNEGGWLSITTGVTSDTSTVTPFEANVSAWSVRPRLALVGSITSAWLAGQHHVDMVGAARWTGSWFEIEARVGARPLDNFVPVDDEPARVWGEVAALLPIASRFSIALSGGSYPSDPLRRLRGARYATAGLQIDLTGRKHASDIVPAVLAGVRRDSSESAAPARLEVSAAGERRVVRIYAREAQSVELIGDFTDWQPLPLVRVARDSWQVELPIVEGVHRVNVRLDGGPWFVPAGARSEQDEFGSTVGVIVVR